MEQTMEKENIMGTMPEGKLLLKLAMPMIFSVLVSSLYNIVDSIFVGRMGQNALTAISLGAPASSLMVELSFGVAVGVNAMLSRKLGEKDSEGVSKAAGQGFLLIGVVYLICLAFGLFGVRAFYSIQTSEEEIIALGVQYTSIVTICSFGLMIQSIVERLLSATGRTKGSMAVLLTGAVTNIIPISMKASAAIMVVGSILYVTIPALLLGIFSATDEMLAIGIPAFRIIGITAIISGMTIMMSGVFQAMNNSNKALIISIVQAASLVGSAALMALTGSATIVWFSFPISEIVIFALSWIFLKGIYREHLDEKIEKKVDPMQSNLKVKAASNIM